MRIIGQRRGETYPEPRGPGAQGPQGAPGPQGPQGTPGTPSNFRTVASGTTVIPGGEGVQLGPFTRVGTELWDLWDFPTTIVDEASWGAGQNNDLSWFFFHKSGDDPTEMTLSLFNFTGGSITVDWAIIGYTP